MEFKSHFLYLLDDFIRFKKGVKMLVLLNVHAHTLTLSGLLRDASYKIKQLIIAYKKGGMT